jgi:DNA-binding response OmpR family regulator
MTEKILIIEDESGLVMALQDRLESEGYLVDSRYDGKSGESAAASSQYDCIILDIMLPERDGYQVCRNLREAECRTPVLMLTARSTNIDTVLGLRIGADDYLVKPFDMQVLLARIEALIRRSRQNHNRGFTGGDYCFGDFRLDIEGNTLYHGENAVALNAQEYRLLKYLIEKEGKTIQREKLLDDVWGYDNMTSTRTVDVHIARLRQKLGESEVPRHLITVRGLGYRFDR